MSATENQAVYGKCNNPYGHGHNYTVEITVAGQVDAITGMVCNLGDLDAFVNEKILDRFGHENLNLLSEFQNTVPTTENFCVKLYQILERGFKPARVERVRVEETMLNSFEYAGGRAIRN
jgi:6-pyruvoyltetrahydropterin/6-carboxytetrahydropterin synthase